MREGSYPQGFAASRRNESAPLIDLHSHILPGLDDGPRTLAGTLELARTAVAAGVDTITATPHIDFQYAVDPAEVRIGVAALGVALRDARIDLSVSPGGEVDLSRLPTLDRAALTDIRLGRGRHLLIECPLAPTASAIDSDVAMLMIDGWGVVLAHPERSPQFQRNPDALAALVADGVLCSVTASSFVGRFGRPARDLALAMLKYGLVHNVASDAHDHRRRPPILDPGLTEAARHVEDFPALAEWLTRDLPAAVLGGDPLPPRPGRVVGPRRRRRSLLALRRAS